MFSFMKLFKSHKPINVFLVGAEGGEKSKYGSHLADKGEKGDYHFSSIGVEFRNATYGDKKFQIWDTVGQEKFKLLTPNTQKKMDVFLLCPTKEEQLEQSLKMVDNEEKPSSKTCMVVIDSSSINDIELENKIYEEACLRGLPIIESPLNKARDQILQLIFSNLNLTPEQREAQRKEIIDSTWKKMILKVGCDPKLLDAVIKTNAVKDYHHLYEVYYQIKHVVGAEIKDSWALMCLSGERSALEYAKKHMGLSRYSLSELVTFDEWRNRDAIFFAAFSGNLDAVKYVIDELGVSVKGGLLSDMFALIGASNGMHALEGAALSGNAKMLEYLLNVLKIQEHREQDTHRNNLMHYAAWSGNIDAISYIRENILPPINPEYFGAHGKNVFHCAVQSRNLKAIQYVASFISNPKALDANGNNAIHIAASLGDLKTVKLLHEELKIDPNEKSKSGGNALYIALLNRHRNIMEYFIDELKMSASSGCITSEVETKEEDKSRRLSP